jgi:hypothetical protein
MIERICVAGPALQTQRKLELRRILAPPCQKTAVGMDGLLGTVEPDTIVEMRFSFI